MMGEDRFVELSEAISLREKWRQQGKRVVFTNGCFDLLHPGHVTYLEDAKALGDMLIIGLNSDDSIRRLKGDSRPVNRLEDRAHMLAGLRSVDLVVPFSEDTPIQLIAALLPDVLVKGGDYRPDDIVGAKEVRRAGGEVVVVPFLNGHSSTSLIGKIQKLSS
ncbi:MAG TPA: D-glycero-beta-D-manno-heptose 1-phosphate adenylyltransferase [Mariprofundaceae bacterium]|nr:D-glycero-beta-D-manno-heptose 1-phosphate adenylyltransferase [Mariprofundaceae bacterium]